MASSAQQREVWKSGTVGETASHKSRLVDWSSGKFILPRVAAGLLETKLSQLLYKG
jgi:hypothetical protein